MSEIRIYVEGGGNNSRYTRDRFRHGFSRFLRGLGAQARSKGIRWEVIPGGSRRECFKKFKRALQEYPGAFNVLLVDSDGPVDKASPWAHLHMQEGWPRPRGMNDRQCHLMVQLMEVWFLGDQDALAHDGAQFNRTALPRNRNLEAIAKEVVVEGLERATRNTLKGRYDKGRHAAELLEEVSAARVRHAAAHCDSFFRAIESWMSENG